MKIESSTVRLTSQHSLTAEQSETESLRAWVNAPAADSSAGRVTRTVSPRQDVLSLSSEARSAAASSEVDGEEAVDPKLQVARLVIEGLIGHRLRLASLRHRSDAAHHADPQGQAKGAAASASPNWGVQYDAVSTTSEAEQADFAAEGVVRTSDGREIQFSAQLSLSRSYTSTEEVHFRAGQALTDPLVIDFSGTATTLTSGSYDFDLDADGELEQMPFVGTGGGFLTLDLNGDGVVTDGTELFGPKTGDGFTELAGYDADGNQWIDEGDAVYQRLQVWSKDEQGNDVLTGLAETGVGAIYLGQVANPFSVRDQENNAVAEVRASSVYLREDGTAGVVHQVDLVAG